MPDFYLLIPCYNNREGLIRSLQSISYPHQLFSVVVVDDGSDEPVTRELIGKKISEDFPLTILYSPKNEGITKALNRGLEWIYSNTKAAFIARLDCGDVCAQDRFYKQVEFLRSHPEINLVGTWCQFKDYQSGNAYNYITPTLHDRIITSMHFRNVFIHPTVMWRYDPDKPVQYPEAFPHAEDYGLFNQILIDGKSAVIPEYLVTCELNEKGISFSNRRQQLKSRISVVRAYGTNKLLAGLGICKLWLLMIIPYALLFRIKRVLYSA